LFDAQDEFTSSSAIAVVRARRIPFKYRPLHGKIFFVVPVPPPLVSFGARMAVSLSGITISLRAWRNGDDQALDRLTSLVYAELHRLAQCYMARQNPDHVLQSTALISEIYLRLGNVRETDWQNRSHFFAVCSQLMRHTLTDYARSRLQVKRGGEAQRVPFDENLEVPNRDPNAKLIALDDALHDLAAFDERKSQIVQLRFFGGFSVQETAEALSISEKTVRREWKMAQAWLLRELKREKKSGK